MLVVLIVVGGTGGLVAPAAQAAESPETTIYIEATGHHLGGAFLAAWQANGGMLTFGYPISEPLTEDGMLVQYFERARLEYHPEHAGSRYEVQASHLGTWAAADRLNERPFRPLEPGLRTTNGPNRRYFPETGHAVAYAFKEFWERYGGLYAFGYPISEEFLERNPETGQTFKVQYFERARFEHHPELAGTPYEFMLGQLGRDFARENGVANHPVDQRPDAMLAFPGMLDPRWSQAVRTPEGAAIGVVADDVLPIYAAPSLAAPIQEYTYGRHTVVVEELVQGDEVNGSPAWYRIGPDRYVSAKAIEPFVAEKPQRYFGGRWADVSLTTFYAVVYDDNRPVYAALITAGRDGRTPLGAYEIFRRVRSETMDAATLGTPEDDPEYYKLENVEYTQYFKMGGYALHGNYWTPPWQYGGFSSNGCIGLRNDHAAWFWDFLGNGSIINIYY